MIETEIRTEQVPSHQSRLSTEEYIRDPFFQEFLEVLQLPRLPGYVEKCRLTKYISNTAEHKSAMSDRIIAFFANNVRDLYKMMRYPTALKIWLSFRYNNNVNHIAQHTRISYCNVQHWVGKFLMIGLLKVNTEFQSGNERLYSKAFDYRDSKGRMNVVIPLIDFVAKNKLNQYVLETAKKKVEREMEFLKDN